MAVNRDLSQAQWEFVEPIIPKPKVRPDGRGRPWRDAREVLNGILWVIRTGAPWRDLPSRYPSYQTCHRRFQQWRRDGTIEKVLSHLAGYRPEEGERDPSGTFPAADVGSPASPSRSGGRGRRSWSAPTAEVWLSPR